MRSFESQRRGAPLAIFALACLLACEGDGGKSAPPEGSGSDTAGVTAKTFRICPGPDAQKETLVAFFDAREGDVIEFCAGQFDFTTSLLLTGKRGITIRGAGRDQTILSFAKSDGQDGVNVNRVDGITVESLTIYDSPGNGLRVFKSDFVTIRNVKVGWSNADPASPNYEFDPKGAWSKNGAYAFYPVLCRHVLIEDSVSIGSSDAGVYVGQSSDILVRRTEAFHNVAGFEFENTYRAEFVDNVAHDNVGGFLVFDLPGRAQFGEKNRVHRNLTYRNNLPSFAPRGAIVGSIPSGTGILVLASDQLEIHDNEIRDNRTVGLAIVNYALADAGESSTRYDFYPEGIHVYRNTFLDNGANPALPDLARSTCKGAPGLPAGLPGPSEDITCLADNPSLLPLILVVKNLGRSAQIIWDGAVDHPNGCTDVPVDRDGIPLTQPNPNETDRTEARADERGRPNLYLFDPNPSCKYNAWKFDDGGALKKPENGLCIEENTFRQTSLTGALVSKYANVHFGTTDVTNPENLVPADNTMPRDCPLPDPTTVAEYAPNLGTFTPDPSTDPHPSDAEVAALCVAPPAGEVNVEALAKVNCPRLDQYGLFADPADPRKDPNGSGVPFDLNTILFSDYAVKYRFLYLPPDGAGGVVKATYMDASDCDTFNIYSCETATLGFPVGTVFAKTFAFRNGAEEDVVETRLLIKRQAASGAIRWVGLPYLWKTDATGARVADLLIEGGTKRVTYDYDDPSPDVVDAAGNPRHYGPATVESYQIPSAGACVLCHGGDDREAGAAPIGPKVRNLNRDHDFADAGTMNQLAYLAQKGMLDLPAEPDGLERMPKFDVPGSTGEAPGSPADVHKRVRAYLEVNCMHCHNPAGGAQNSGLSLDAANDPMDEGHGICKPPIAAGRAADIGNYDIQPGSASQSILASRIASTERGIRMPPLARTVAHAEAVELVNPWVDDVVADFAADEANTCGGGSLGLPLALAAH